MDNRCRRCITARATATKCSKRNFRRMWKVHAVLFSCAARRIRDSSIVFVYVTQTNCRHHFAMLSLLPYSTDYGRLVSVIFMVHRCHTYYNNQPETL